MYRIAKELNRDVTETPSTKVKSQRFRLSVVLESEDKLFRGWPTRQWKLAAVICDEQGPDSIEGPVTIRESKTISQFLWKGLKLELFLDAAEGYWYNLLSDIPFVFVVCDHDEEDDNAVPVPYLVTASQDEAGAHLETDCLVLSSPLPANLRDKVEEYVVNNYVPKTKKKRKRKNWAQESVRDGPDFRRRDMPQR